MGEYWARKLPAGNIPRRLGFHISIHGIIDVLAENHGSDHFAVELFVHAGYSCNGKVQNFS